MEKKGTVIVPAYNRPEFLSLCIDYIHKANGSANYKYLFCFDSGYEKDNDIVIQKFKYEYSVIKLESHPYHKGTKLAFNILNGYMNAIDGGGLVYLIEEDVFIGVDYFNWHEQVQELEDVFCSIAAANFNNRNHPKGEAHEYYIDSGIYQSVGVCFKADKIRQYIEPHFNGLYFANPYRYAKEIFPNSKIDASCVEQAGIIHRVSELNNLKIAFPYIPRCFHAGIYGKNRGIPQKGTLVQKIEFIKHTVFDINEMRKYVSNEYYLYDSKPENLTVTTNKKLCRI